MNSVFALALLGLAGYLYLNPQLLSGSTGGGSGSGSGSGAGAGSGSTGGGSTGSGSGSGGGSTGGSSGTGGGAGEPPVITYTSEQEAHARSLGFNSAADYVAYNSAVRRGLIPDDTTAQQYYQWLSGRYEGISQDQLRTFATAGDPVSIHILKNQNDLLTFDQWNAYRTNTAGTPVPAEAMNSIPANIRWSPVNIETYRAWLEGAGLAGLAGLGAINAYWD